MESGGLSWFMNGFKHDEKERCNQYHTLLEASVASLGSGPGQQSGSVETVLELYIVYGRLGCCM